MLRIPALIAAIVLVAGTGIGAGADADGLSAERLGVIYNADDASSKEIALFYAERRQIPSGNIVGAHLGSADTLTPGFFATLRHETLDRLPTAVQSLALVWFRPFAVGCMSITTAFAAGYRSAFCDPGCAITAPNPLFDSDGWLPPDTVGWWPAMLIPTDDPGAARALIERGIASDGTAPPGMVYLVRTNDTARNVRSATYAEVELSLAKQLRIKELSEPVAGDADAAIAYFTGAAHVAELPRIHFRAGAVADHLTSSGGVLSGGSQMPATKWLEQGATASYGSVSEPCNHLGKFPDVGVLLRHYLLGETVMEAYWKSVQMPGQGLFIGEPLARPYATRLR